MTIHQDETDYRVLQLLAANPEINQRELAGALGVSLGKINYCLRALLDKGLIKIQNFKNSENKRAYAYLLTPVGITEKSELTARFLKRKMDEYERLRSEIEILKSELEQTNGMRTG
ncbi:MarR family EPS-associated transcriptional regulator [Cupriavidus sp. 8B]